MFNTLFNLLTQDAQVRCFENVAAHLTADGSFIVEAFRACSFLSLAGQSILDAEAIEVDKVRLDVARHDPVMQLLDESHVLLSAEGVRLIRSSSDTHGHASDLMARIAGLHLKDRWAGWDRAPFTFTASRRVSVYGR